MRFKITDAEVKKAMKELVIIIDTQEKKNEHIREWFDKKKVKYRCQKLDQGDYSAHLPKGALKGIDRELYFDKDIVIERKASIDEIAGNFSKTDYARISKEFAFLKANGTKVRLFVEDGLFHKHIREGKYRSKYEPKTLHARIKGFEAEFNTTVEAIPIKCMASEIYNTLYYEVRNILLREFEIERIDIEEGE